MFKRNLTPAVKRPPRITAEGDSDTTQSDHNLEWINSLHLFFFHSRYCKLNSGAWVSPQLLSKLNLTSLKGFAFLSRLYLVGAAVGLSETPVMTLMADHLTMAFLFWLSSNLAHLYFVTQERSGSILERQLCLIFNDEAIMEEMTQLRRLNHWSELRRNFLFVIFSLFLLIENRGKN